MEMGRTYCKSDDRWIKNILERRPRADKRSRGTDRWLEKSCEELDGTETTENI